jgi:hypothetical protein
MPLLNAIKLNAIRKLNHKAHLAREKADEARAKQMAYRIPLDEETTKKRMQAELNQNTLNIDPMILAQKIIDEFSSALPKLLDGRPKRAQVLAQQLLQNLRLYYNDYQKKSPFHQTSIDAIQYLALCIKNIKTHETELSKPYTFSEKFNASVMKAISAIVDAFNLAWSWVFSLEKTAEKNSRKTPTTNSPRTVLGKTIIEFKQTLEHLLSEAEYLHLQNESIKDKKLKKEARRAAYLQNPSHLQKQPLEPPKITIMIPCSSHQTYQEKSDAKLMRQLLRMGLFSVESAPTSPVNSNANDSLNSTSHAL